MKAPDMTVSAGRGHPLTKDKTMSRSSAIFAFRNPLKYALYLAAILLLPGALIGAPVLWWLWRSKGRAPSSSAGRLQGVDGRCSHCG